MSIVYFTPISKITNLSETAATLLQTIIDQEKISLPKDLLIKIHPGAIGNNSFVPATHYDGMIEYLLNKEINPSYVETCMSGEPSTGKLNEFKEHGFSQIPVVIADGPEGNDHELVTIPKGKHLTHSLIASRLASRSQVLVVNHFKGHCMAGFGGALKMLGIGFASGQGKVLIHGTTTEYKIGDNIEWDKTKLPGISKKWVLNWNPKLVSSGTEFVERVAESAWAAAFGKHHLYITFAINIVNNCDCDGESMTPVYKDVGIFASLDPVAIDKAAFDMLAQQIGEPPFEGTEIFTHAESLGLGSIIYDLVEV